MLFIACWAAAQNPVKWDFKAKQTAPNEYDLFFNATIQDGWKIYSQFIEGDGPIPTSFEFDKKDKHYQTVGKIDENGDKKTEFDKVFGIQLTKFYHNASFKQHVKVTDASKPIKGYLTFMTCNDKTCLPPKDIDFNIALSNVSNLNEKAATTEKNEIEKAPKDSKNENNDLHVPPVNLGEPTTAAKEHSNNTTTNNNPSTTVFDSKRAIDKDKFVADCGVGEVQNSDSLFWIFIFGFLGGLVALLTPCVFPMIPLTVSFFTKSSKDKASGIRNALIYSASIIIIYVGIGLIITSIFGTTALNEMSTDMYFNLLFFVVFILFAGSFFGYYEITLPSSWSNKSDKAADKGGLIGIFFMAFTLALVSFSCTGPIIGTLLVQTVQNANDALFGFIPLKPLAGMFGFALALALPFGLFAAFPSWLNTLPKSGSWLTNVKVTLGFIELALAFKFLSTADMVRHWNFLKLELFLGIWMLIFFCLALYQFGFIKFPHDSPLKK